MKFNFKKTVAQILTILGILALYQSCTNCEKTMRYMALVPVYQHINDLRAGIGVELPRSLKNPGKIYTYDDLLLVNEVDEGIHVIDNSNAASPLPLKFIRISGNKDITVVNNFLYADQGPDLTVWDISDLENIRLVSRTQAILNRDWMKGDSFPVRFEEREIVEVQEDADCGGSRWGGGWFRAEVDFASSSGSGGNGGSTTGQAGSMSRFTYADGYIYIVDQSRLKSLNVQTPSSPVLEGDHEIAFEAETIFPYKKYLLLGTTTGMAIFDRVADPRRPVYLTSFSHVRGCDPVVVYDDLAYVTLRGGSPCGAAADELHVVDISNIGNPTLLTSYPMEEPYGLAANSNLLMVCDGSAGLKTYNRLKTFELHNHQYSVIRGKTTYDVILNGSHAILTAQEGIFQYDFSDPVNPVELGVLFSE